MSKQREESVKRLKEQIVLKKGDLEGIRDRIMDYDDRLSWNQRDKAALSNIGYRLAKVSQSIKNIEKSTRERTTKILRRKETVKVIPEPVQNLTTKELEDEIQQAPTDKYEHAFEIENISAVSDYLNKRKELAKLQTREKELIEKIQAFNSPEIQQLNESAKKQRTELLLEISALERSFVALEEEIRKERELRKVAAQQHQKLQESVRAQKTKEESIARQSLEETEAESTGALKREHKRLQRQLRKEAEIKQRRTAAAERARLLQKQEDERLAEASKTIEEMKARREKEIAEKEKAAQRIEETLKQKQAKSEPYHPHPPTEPKKPKKRKPKSAPQKASEDSKKKQKKAILNPYTIMRKEVTKAAKSGKFDQEEFKKNMKVQLLGKGYTDFRNSLDNETQTKLLAAEEKFDIAIAKLSTEVDKEIKDDTLYKPQKNGAIRSTLKTVLYALAGVFSLIATAAVAFFSFSQQDMHSKKLYVEVGDNRYSFSAFAVPSFIAAGGVIAAGVAALSRHIDKTNPSSKAEQYMDQLIEATDREFDSHMQTIVAQKAGTEEEKYATKFSDTIRKRKEMGATFLMREKARREAVDTDKKR